MLDIVQVSDIHLSPTHAWFQDNWDVFVEAMAADPPDFIFVTGDVCVNGPDREHEFAYAREQLDRLSVPWRAIPGNHDSGDTPPDERNHHPLTEPLRQTFRETIDEDFWLHDLANWRFIGLNAQLMDSGLPSEPVQWAFLEQALGDAAGRQLAIWVHKPLFVRKIEDPNRFLTALFPEARARMIGLCSRYGVKLVGSGHLHRFRRQRVGDTRLIWAPSTAFLMGARKGLPGMARLGYMRYRFGRSSFTARLIEPPLFLNLDVRNWNAHKGSTIHLPPRLPRPATGEPLPRTDLLGEANPPGGRSVKNG
ncbi:MAG TPA: metallophosphoesterase [Alphaproteobacteria bacterium]|nr:metallophosphoesterase [Alphaproteobacteria bacterium]